MSTVRRLRRRVRLYRRLIALLGVLLVIQTVDTFSPSTLNGDFINNGVAAGHRSYTISTWEWIPLFSVVAGALGTARATSSTEYLRG
ncbi:MAG: hypothetical protein KGR42_04460 [Acidobacteria bacterium]|nr:hypothetical protein [Acidobacteriota bacterium]